MTFKKTLSCWNNYPTSTAYLQRPESCKELLLAKEGTTLARGLGRSYGDAALNKDNTLMLMERMNRFLAFDEKSGLLRAEAGASISEILSIFIPKGWFLPVTPGTKFTTLGGCFAADVHGKNHHVDGTFSRHVTEIELLIADGSRLRCSPTQNADLFWATAGGMGLTGIITEITLKLLPIETSFISVTHHVASHYERLLSYFDNPECHDKYSVAWIDCLAKGNEMGRGILMTGHHATRAEVAAKWPNPLQPAKPGWLSVPCFFPSRTLNYWSVRAFNSVFYKTQSSKEHYLTSAESYFYPLDKINNWNRIYGRRGFMQYQCVIPMENARKALPILLNRLSDSRRPSFLAVIKRFGQEGSGLLSFPREGITLALDLPYVDKSIFPFLDQLDYITLSYGGRVYLAKDARMKPEIFRKMYPKLDQWQQIKKTVDPHDRFASDLGHRLRMGCA